MYRVLKLCIPWSLLDSLPTWLVSIRALIRALLAAQRTNAPAHLGSSVLKINSRISIVAMGQPLVTATRARGARDLVSRLPLL